MQILGCKWGCLHGLLAGGLIGLRSWVLFSQHFQALWSDGLQSTTHTGKQGICGLALDVMLGTTADLMIVHTHTAFLNLALCARLCVSCGGREHSWFLRRTQYVQVHAWVQVWYCDSAHQSALSPACACALQQDMHHYFLHINVQSHLHSFSQCDCLKETGNSCPPHVLRRQ